jgi:hypothetical protein
MTSSPRPPDEIRTPPTSIGIRQWSGAAEVAWCPEHGLHGQRTTCHVCDGPVEQVTMMPAREVVAAMASCLVVGVAAGVALAQLPLTVTVGLPFLAAWCGVIIFGWANAITRRLHRSGGPS